VGEKDKAREEFVQEAGRMYDAMVGRAEQRCDDRFDDIEQQAEACGREVALRLLKQRLAAEESRQSEQVACPVCGQPMRRPQKASPRKLDTASGQVNYARRHAICDRCGVSFSPSGSKAGDSPTGRVKPAAEEGL